MATAAPIDIMDTLSKEFECSICMERLRNARCLFCQHTFCYDCLVNCVQSGREAANVITCPVCRVVTRMPRDGVAGLKSNALINSVLGKLEEWEEAKKHGPNAQGDAKGKGSTLCQSCKKSMRTTPYFCKECKQHLCLECVQGQRHKSHHRTFSGPDADQNCEVHCWMPATLYCSHCDKLACNLCNHGANTTIPLQQKVSEIHDMMEAYADDCSNKSVLIQTSHHEVNHSKEYTVETIQGMIAEIHQKALKVMSKVTESEAMLVQHLRTIKTKVEEEMEEKHNRCSILEDELQRVVTGWQNLMESSNGAELIKKHVSLKKKMDELLEADAVFPSSDLSRSLQNHGIEFIPGKLFLEASCDSGYELGSLKAKPRWEGSHYVELNYDSISQLMFMEDGKLLAADSWNGIDSIDPDPFGGRGITTILSGETIRDFTVLAGNMIVYQNNDKAVFTIKDGSSKLIQEFGAKWVSVTCCPSPSDRKDLIAVANQNYHDQDVFITDADGNMANTIAMSFVGGVRNLRFDKCQNAIFIDYNRRAVRCQRLLSDGFQKFVIEEEDTVYLSVACHQSNFLYVASQSASVPNVISIKKHSLEDGQFLQVVLDGEPVLQSFRTAMANWKDKFIAVSKGHQVLFIEAEKDATAAAVLQRP